MKEKAVGEYNSGGKTKRNSPSLLTFLSKYTGWKSHKEEFSFYLRRKTGKNFPWLWHSVRLNGSLVTNVERLCGVFRESVGRWRFRADGDLSPTPLDSLTHAVMTLADAYNLPTECQSLVPLQPKIDPCHALLPPFIPLIWLLLGPPSPILHRNVSFVAALGPFQDPWTVRKISFARSFFPQRSSSFLPRESRRTSHFECKVKIWGDTFH